MRHITMPAREYHGEHNLFIPGELNEFIRDREEKRERRFLILLFTVTAALMSVAALTFGVYGLFLP
jgi:hypothetical protein